MHLKKTEKLLKQHGLSWYGLAKKAGLPIPSIYHYKAGRAVPSATHASAIARALGVSVEELWGEDVTKSAARRLEDGGWLPKGTAAIHWIIPEDDHAEAAALGWVEPDRKKYLARMKQIPSNMAELGFAVPKAVQVEASLADVLREVKMVKAEVPVEARLLALVRIARRRGLI